MRNRILTSVLAGAFALTLAACGQSANTAGTAAEPGDNAGATIGIAMPTKSSERWIGDGDNMVEQFEAKGYKTDLQYGDNIVENQVSQIENMITKGDRLLVIAAIDGSALSDVLQRAKDAGISVISYDRLIRESPNVDYYATFDNFQVGVLQGTYIAEKLGLATATAPKTVELFAGSPDDNNAKFFFDGAMSILQPFIDKGTLSVASGQTDFTQAATLRWDGGVAQTRMDNLLSGSYSDKNLDAVLSPYDGISIGVLSSLKGVGYGGAGKPMPVVTGQDAELASVKSINADEQTQTVYKDTRELAKIAVEMADAILTGGTPPVNDTEQYDNGVKVVPSYLLEPVNVDKSNITEVLVGGGYYTAEQIAG